MRQIEKHLRRIIAVLLSAVLVFSAFEGVSITGYAAENTDVKDISAKKDTQNGEEENDGDSLAKRAPAEGTPAEEPQTSSETAGETREGTPEETTSEESIPEETALEESIPEETESAEGEEETASAESEEETVAGEEEVLLLNEGDAQDSEQYTGAVEIYDNGWRELHISEGEFNEFYNNANEDGAEEGQESKAFDDTAIIAILTGHENDADKFDAVSIEYSAIADHDAISKELWNAVADFQGKKDDFYATFCYYGEGDLDRNWFFGNPINTANESGVNIQVTKLEIQSSEGDGVIVAFADTAFPADYAEFDTYTETSRTNGGKYEALGKAFGGDGNGFELKLSVYSGEQEEEGVEGVYWTDEDSENNVQKAGFGIGNIKNLTADTEYTLKKAIYKGEIWEDEENGRRGLDIDYRRAGKETALELDEIQEILSYHTDEKFDEIYIGQPSSENDNNVISKDIANVMYPYLKTGTDNDDCRLRFGFVGENESCTEWKLWNPEPQQDSDQTVSAEMTVKDDTISVKINQKPDAKSKSVELAFSRNKESDDSTVAEIINILGEDECEIVFRNGDTEIGGWYSNNEWQVCLDISAANEMTENTKYTVEKAVYKGDIWEDDEDGTIRVGLNINYHSAGKDTALTAAEIQEILNRRRDEKFDEIYLEQPNSDSNVIFKEVADMLYGWLKPQEDAAERSLTFAFLNEEDESTVRWRLVNPAEEQDDDQPVSAEFKISGDNKVRIKASAQLLKAENVELCFSRNNHKDKETVDKLKEIFGGKDCELVLSCGNQEETDGSFHIDINEEEPEYYNVFINVHHVNDLAVDTEYTVEKSRYLGDISERYILISSFNRFYDQDRFQSEQLEEIITFYESEGRSFDSVLIQQRYTGNNTIDKDLINIAMRILSDAPDKCLSFCFCHCEGIDENFKQDDFIWSFVNPATAQKNINGNVIIKTDKNRGITVQIPENRPYSADNVCFKYYCAPNSNTGARFAEALGKPEDFGSEKTNDLFILNKETNIPDNHVESYYMTKEELEDSDGNLSYDQNYSLYFNNVHEWIPDKEFWLTKLECLWETAVGEYKLPALPDGAQNPEWQSYDTDIAIIEGDALKQVNNNEGYVHFSVSYTLGGEIYQKAYRVYMVSGEIALERLKFNKNQLTMELPPPNEDWEALEFLEVKYYPANATIDANQLNLTWTTTNPKVVALKRRSDGKCEGEIKAVGAGTATIRAAYNDKIYAECVVTVEEPIIIADGAWPEPYAVTNVDTTLNDVRLPSDDAGEWKWKEPSTSLSPYISMEWHDFAAVYTRKTDGKKMEATVGVRMVSVSGVNIIPFGETQDIPLALTNGQTIQLSQEAAVANGDYNTDIAGNTKYSSRFDIRWSTKPAGILRESADADNTKFQSFTADAVTGKKTITVSVVNRQTNKVIAKDSIIINVTKNPVMNFGELKVTVDDILQNDNQWIRLDKDAKPTGVIAFATDNAANKDYTLAVKSSDTSVIQVKADGSNKISYILKNYGKAQFTVTANDEIKSSYNIEVSVPDKQPQIIQSQVTVNKASVDKKARLTIVYADGYQADGAVTVDGNDFSFEDGYLVLSNTNLKGTVSAKVKIKCISDDNKDAFTAEKTVTVKLVEKAPKVTLKQTKKVNAFYKNSSDSHAGILTVSAGSSGVSDVRMDSSADFELAASDAKDSYRIRLKDGRTASSQTVAIYYTITDNTGTKFEVKKDLRVAVENKAPKLVLSTKSDTLYPKADFNDSVLTISDKATGRPIELTSIKYNNQEIANTIALKKNSFDIALEENTRIRFNLHNGRYVKGTDKITLGIENGEWTKPVNVSYSLKVDEKEPKLKLSSARLTLNKNEAAGVYQSVEVTLTLAGRSTPFDGYVTFDGPSNILNHVIALDDKGEGRIGVRLHVSKEELQSLSEGSHQFKLTAQKDNWKQKEPTILTVDIKNLASDKCIKVSKKGSIDVLRRDQTYIAYQPKITNLAGRVVDGRITGRDANLFDAEYDELTGQVRVKARQNGVDSNGNEIIWNYATKAVYKVAPVFTLETADGYLYEVTAPEQPLKVAQGRPKVTVLSDYGNTLYRQAGGGNLTFGIAAELANESIAVKDVTLANYKKDLSIRYDEESHTVTLSQTAMKEITKTGKAWNVKLAIRYANKAGNEKDTIVTYKVIIK